METVKWIKKAFSERKLFNVVKYKGWKYAIENEQLTSDFIRKHFFLEEEELRYHGIHRTTIIEFQKLSEDIIEEKFFKEDCIHFAITKQQLSEDFLRRHRKKIIEKWGPYWSWTVPYSQKLSESFIEEFEDEFNLAAILWKQHLSIPFIEKRVDRFKAVSEDKIFFRISKDNSIDGWALISAHQKLSEDFIRRYQDKVRWDVITLYQKLSYSFIKEFWDKLEKSFLFKNDSLDLETKVKFRIGNVYKSYILKMLGRKNG